MQYTTVTVLALVAVASAMPTVLQQRSADVSLPKGCSKEDAAHCAEHLVGTSATCAAAALELGADPAADLACIASAATTAESFDECKPCIPKHVKAREPEPVVVEQRQPEADISLPKGCSKKDAAHCAEHLIGTTASCTAALLELGADPAADLACIASAAGTAEKFDECKPCIPK